MAQLLIADISLTTARLEIAALTATGTNRYWQRNTDGSWSPTWRSPWTASPGQAISSDWLPVQLVDLERPTGAQYQRYEDVTNATQNAITGIWSVNLETAFNAVSAGKKLTLPTGIFEFTTFERADKKGLSFGRQALGYPGVEGSANTGCVGIIGSGRDTVWRPSTSITTSNPNKDTGSAYLRGTSVEFYKIVGLELANFTLTGKDTPTWDGDYFGGIDVYRCTGANLHHLFLRGASPGWGSSPPAETFGLNIRSDNARVTDTEVDGRHANSDERVCASPIGWNGSGAYPGYTFATNALVERVYVHHGRSSMLTFWLTNGITVTDFWCFSTAASGYSGQGINFEQPGSSPITLTRCHLFLNQAEATAAPPYPLPAGDQQSSSGFHLSLNLADVPGAGVMTRPTVTVTEPDWDKCYTSTLPDPGLLMVECPNGYCPNDVPGGVGLWTGIDDVAHVVKNGTVLPPSVHPTSGWQNNAGHYARIT